MNALLSLAIVFAQETPARVEPWKGGLAQGLTEMQALTEAEKPDEALALADRILAPGRFAQWRERATAQPGWKRKLVEAVEPLLAAVGISDLSQPERAAVHFSRGVVLARTEKRLEATGAFEQARALAGPGELRLDATYDLGWTALAQGEILRAQIPELGGTPPTPPAAAPSAPPAPGDAKPDPLELARAAYTKAREHFVERLKSDARDADTRANAELAHKRLRELAEIQKKREEEKKKQEEQQKQDEKKNDPDKKDQPSQDQKKSDEPPKPDDQKKNEQGKDEEKEPEKEKESEAEKEEKKESQPQSAKEGPLTKEEIMRLLDTLKNREEEGRKLQEQLRRARRAKVKKDW